MEKIDIDNTVISPGALTIIEQIPGLTVSDDMTEYFKKGYWPSYNSAYFPKIRDLSGYEKQIQEHPELKDVLDYTSGARANIFRRDQAKVVDIESYKKMFCNLKEMTPTFNCDLSIFVVEQKDYLDENIYYEVLGKRVGDNERYALDFIPWSDWLGCTVVEKSIELFGEVLFVAECLHFLCFCIQ